jgi:hypothetical protein
MSSNKQNDSVVAFELSSLDAHSLTGPRESQSKQPKHQTQQANHHEKETTKKHLRALDYAEQGSISMPHPVQYLTACDFSPQSQKAASSRSERSGVGNRPGLGVGGDVRPTEDCEGAFDSARNSWLDVAEPRRTTGLDLTFEACLAEVTCDELGSAALPRSAE